MGRVSEATAVLVSHVPLRPVVLFRDLPVVSWSQGSWLISSGTAVLTGSLSQPSRS